MPNYKALTALNLAAAGIGERHLKKRALADERLAEFADWFTKEGIRQAFETKKAGQGRELDISDDELSGTAGRLNDMRKSAIEAGMPAERIAAIDEMLGAVSSARRTGKSFDDPRLTSIAGELSAINKQADDVKAAKESAAETRLNEGSRASLLRAEAAKIRATTLERIAKAKAEAGRVKFTTTGPDGEPVERTYLSKDFQDMIDYKRDEVKGMRESLDDLLYYEEYIKKAVSEDDDPNAYAEYRNLLRKPAVERHSEIREAEEELKRMNDARAKSAESGDRDAEEAFWKAFESMPDEE